MKQFFTLNNSIICIERVIGYGMRITATIIDHDIADDREENEELMAHLVPNFEDYCFPKSLRFGHVVMPEGTDFSALKSWVDTVSDPEEFCMEAELDRRDDEFYELQEIEESARSFMNVARLLTRPQLFTQHAVLCIQMEGVGLNSNSPLVIEVNKLVKEVVYG